MRRSTRFIILHTTEGARRGSGEKLKRNGEANYMIDEAGRIYRIVDRRRVAYHCGRSMWDGLTSIDNCSVGIEMVGYHNKDLTAAQIKSLKSLIEELQKIYKVPDKRVLPHSMVAYGAPNQWHKCSHRGRKRCGMRMAIQSVRKQLGLYGRPDEDPDVKARRLVVADAYLQSVLYSKDTEADEKKAVDAYAAVEKGNVIGPGRTAWDIARDEYNSATTTYIFPDGKRKTGAEMTAYDWKRLKTGVRVVIGASEAEEPEKVVAVKAAGVAAKAVITSVAGDEWNSKRTIYVQPDGTYFRGSEINSERLAAFKEGTKVFTGYQIDGPITSRRPAFDICGPAWRDSDTYFMMSNGEIVSGDVVDPKKIPRNTMIIFKD